MKPSVFKTVNLFKSVGYITKGFAPTKFDRVGRLENEKGILRFEDKWKSEDFGQNWMDAKVSSVKP